MLSTRVTTKNDRLRKRRHAEWRLDATIAFDILHRAGRLEEFHNEVFASELRQRWRETEEMKKKENMEFGMKSESARPSRRRRRKEYERDERMTNIEMEEE